MSEPNILEGSEEDFAQLLVRHGIVGRDPLKAARDRIKAKGGGIENLCVDLLNAKIVESPAVFEEFRASTKVGATCVKCDADHTILYYGGSRYSCRLCQGLLRIADPMESLTWKPGKKKAKDPAPEPATSFPQGVGGETMLDLGILGKTERPSALPVLEAEFPAGVGGETMLDMGGMAKPAAPAPLPKDPAADASFPQGIGGETMLDMGYVAKAPVTAPPPEEAMVPRAAAGDPAACEAIYHACKGIVWQIASGSLGDYQDSEEALQETFRRLFRSLDKFDPRAGRLKSYVAAVAKNVCRDLQRSRAQRLGREAQELLPDSIVAEAEKDPARDRAEEILKAAGACLDKRSREIVDWKLKGLRNKEIASKLKLDQGTVSSYLTRSVRAIREHLKKTQHSSDGNGSARGH